MPGWLIDEGERKKTMAGTLELMREDLDAALNRDPAARNRFEVLMTYPGVHAVWGIALHTVLAA
jgi:serine acetyltransferase